mmetsp:Transcript_22803/g.33091  ORF Transcript_22803/g.33091 Transcript_22803/m.33091 type:complete len:110 (-) Transcript_22803:11-340(-)
MERKKSGGNMNEEEYFLPKPRPYFQSRKTEYPPPKTTLAALLMLFGGIAVGGIGLCIYLFDEKETERGVALMVIAGILILPGCYATMNLLGAFLGWPGYSYTAIPSYDG